MPRSAKAPFKTPLPAASRLRPGMIRVAIATALAFGFLVSLPLGQPEHSHLRAESRTETPLLLPPAAGESPRASDPAQSSEAEAEEGGSLIEEGVQQLFRGLMGEMEPALNEMDKSLRELAPQFQALGPQLAEIARMVGDFQNYHMPEQLENGDILIRRKTPLPPEAPSLTPPPARESPAPRAPYSPGLRGPDGSIDL